MDKKYLCKLDNDECSDDPCVFFAGEPSDCPKRFTEATRPLAPFGLLKRLVMRFVVFMAIWVAGCFLTDYVFFIEARAWNMWWGWAVGTFALWLADKIQPSV